MYRRAVFSGLPSSSLETNYFGPKPLQESGVHDFCAETPEHVGPSTLSLSLLGFLGPYLSMVETEDETSLASWIAVQAEVPQSPVAECEREINVQCNAPVI